MWSVKSEVLIVQMHYLTAAGILEMGDVFEWATFLLHVTFFWLAIEENAPYFIY